MKTETSPTQQLAADSPPAGDIHHEGTKGTKINGHARTGGGPVIHFPTAEENEAALAEFFGAQRKLNDEGRAAVDVARPALVRLCEVLRGRSGQPYKLRALLWSLYNGQPASLIEIVCLDWQIRKDLCAVLLAFSFEDQRDESNSFYYDELKAAITKAGQWDWFTEADAESEVAK